MKIKTQVIMIFINFSLIWKSFSLGKVRMPKFNVLVLLCLIANHLDSSLYLRAVVAEWLTQLTHILGVPGSNISSPQIFNFHPLMSIFVWAFFSYLLPSKGVLKGWGLENNKELTNSFSVFVELTTK